MVGKEVKQTEVAAVCRTGSSAALVPHATPPREEECEQKCNESMYLRRPIPQWEEEILFIGPKLGHKVLCIEPRNALHGGSLREATPRWCVWDFSGFSSAKSVVIGWGTTAFGWGI